MWAEVDAIFVIGQTRCDVVVKKGRPYFLRSFVPRTEGSGAELAEKAGLQVTAQASVKGRVVHIYSCQKRN